MSTDILYMYSFRMTDRYVRETQDIDLNKGREPSFFKESERRIRFVEDKPIIKQQRSVSRANVFQMGVILIYREVSRQMIHQQ